jgi:integrase
VILVRKAKFGKSRELPLHHTTVKAMAAYMGRGDRPQGVLGTEAIFVTTRGSRLAYEHAYEAFQHLLAGAGIKRRSGSCRPRLHDLRHTFAVRTLLDAYRDGVDPEARLAALSTYLGHVDPTKTYWYLSAAPELLGMAAERLGRHLGESS